MAEITEEGDNIHKNKTMLNKLREDMVIQELLCMLLVLHHIY